MGPDVSVDQSQPVAEGPVGQYVTRSPVGSDGMFFTCDSDQLMGEGPVGQYVTRSPVGSDGMLSTCDSDQPKEGGPMVPQTAFQYHIRNVAIKKIAQWGQGPMVETRTLVI